MDKENGTLNIQDNYLTRARKDRAWLTVVLNNGKKIAGRIKSFDRYTLILEERGSEQMVFKHAIATISTSRAFGNQINFDRAGRAKDAGRRAPAADQAAGDEPPGTTEDAASPPKPTTGS
jgi:host factor-I protein